MHLLFKFIFEFSKAVLLSGFSLKMLSVRLSFATV